MPVSWSVMRATWESHDPVDVNVLPSINEVSLLFLHAHGAPKLNVFQCPTEFTVKCSIP